MNQPEDSFFTNIQAAVALRAATNTAQTELESTPEMVKGNPFTSTTSRGGYTVVITIIKE